MDLSFAGFKVTFFKFIAVNQMANSHEIIQLNLFKF